MKTLRDFIQVIDYHTLAVVVLALIGTWLCRRFDFAVDLPTNLLGIAVIFPLVFSINSAYKRREDALKAYASFKAHAIAIYLAHRDWLPDTSFEDQGRTLIENLFTAVSRYFTANATAVYDSQPIYAIFSKLSRSHEALREAGMPANEVSRLNQYLRSTIIHFEQMNNIAQYRTPLALRAYSRIFLNAFPILFSPFFANVAYPDWPLAGYIVAFVYAVVLVSLDNIQDDLERPYDGQGQDDLRLLNSEAYLQRLFDVEDNELELAD